MLCFKDELTEMFSKRYPSYTRFRTLS